MPLADKDSLSPEEAAALARLLRWYADMGIDIAVDAIAHDRFAESATGAGKAEPAVAAPDPRRATEARIMAPMAPPAETARRGTDPGAASLSADLVAQSASEAAASARTLEELREKLLAFEGCGLKTTATQLVFSDGNPKAEIMIVGEAPGADEDRIGKPFVGRAGQLLDKMLAAIGLDRTNVYIANVVPWRPPGNRTPTPLETSACLPFIRRQIELVHPKILVCLGAASTQTLLGTKDGIMRLRGRWFDYDLGNNLEGAKIPAIAMLHPAYLLRQPGHKKFAWADLRALAKKMKALGVKTA
ncbi:MAG: uracil-DNA glycosylase [Methylovirgula sp.]